MRAAEAIRLGSLMIKPVAGTRNDGNGGGCAIGMGNFSLTGDAGNGADMHTCRAWERRFSWVTKSVFTQLPCSCDSQMVVGSICRITARSCVEASPIMAMVHLFNYHVCTVKDWTIDRLCEWFNSIDPTPRDSEPTLTSCGQVQVNTNTAELS